MPSRIARTRIWSLDPRVPDMIVGKRLYSHLESHLDPDPYGPAVLYWYRTVRNPKAEGGAEFVRS